MKIYLIISLLIFVGAKICKKINNLILTKEERQEEIENSKRQLKNMAESNEFNCIKKAASFFMKCANKTDRYNVLSNLIILVMCFIPVIRIMCISIDIADILVKLKNKHTNKTI